MVAMFFVIGFWFLCELLKPNKKEVRTAYTLTTAKGSAIVITDLNSEKYEIGQKVTRYGMTYTVTNIKEVNGTF